MTLDPRLIKPKLIRNCRVNKTPEQGSMILMPEGVIKLKGTGPEILELCDGVRTLQEIIQALKSRFANQDPEQIEKEVLQFLNQLREKRVMDF